MKVKVTNSGGTLHEPSEAEGAIHKPGAVITVADKRGDQLISAGAVVKHEEAAAQGKEAGKPADKKDDKPKAAAQGKEAGK